MLPDLGSAPTTSLRAARSAPAIVIGLDPSLAAYGWAVLDVTAPRPRVLDAGCVITKKTADLRGYVFEDDAERVERIARELFRVIDGAVTRGSVQIVHEAPGGSKSSAAMKALSFAFSVTRIVCYARGIRPLGVTAGDVKRTLCGVADAEKDRVADAVAARTGWRSKATTQPEVEAESDAVAVAITGAGRAPR